MTTPDGQSYDVLFVGTTKGRLLKIVNTAGSGSSTLTSRPVFIEEMLIFPHDITIGKLSIIKEPQNGQLKHEKLEPRLIILTKDSVVSVPVARCKVAKSCHECTLLQDPYCAWDSEVGHCTALYDISTYPDGTGEPDAGRYLQNVVSGTHDRCGPPPQSFAHLKDFGTTHQWDVKGVHFLITKEGLAN